MTFTLKHYQEHVLAGLQEFFRLARLQGIPAAYDAVAKCKDKNGKAKNPYAAPDYQPIVEGLEERPHVCIRVPTAGGKTYLAACALPLAAHYMEKTFPTVLWFVPSEAIRAQTVAMLKNRSHPCRLKIEKALGSNAMVYDIDDFDIMRPQDFYSRACIIVSTAQMFRITETSKRRIYATHEHFEPHFKRFLPGSSSDSLERDEQGRVKLSFVNLVHLLRPLVVLDEAHNFISNLSHEVLRRINPACVIEWTATPREKKSGEPLHNVLISIPAETLQAEEMVKLPIVVTVHADWEQAVQGAIAEQRRLMQAAQESDDSVRPIVLYQAQNKNQEVPPQVLKTHLLEAGVDEKTIAIATGDIKELPENLLAHDCPIEHIITVDALREGWDCPYAYVLCAISNVRSSTAIEQLMGRVMRMPQATRRRHDALNRAYAHVPKDAVTDAVAAMRDKLAVGLGFEEQSTTWMVQANLFMGAGEAGGLFKANEPAASFETVAKPDFESLSDADKQIAREAVEVRPQKAEEGGGYRVIIRKPLPQSVQRAIVQAMPENKQASEASRLQQASQQLAVIYSPAAKGEEFAPLPQLIFFSPEEGEKVIADADSLYMAAEWNRIGDAPLIEDFSITEDARVFSIFLQGGTVKYEKTGDYYLPLLDDKGDPASESHLSNWLEHQIHCPLRRYFTETLKKIVSANLKKLLENYQIEQLIRAKYQLAEALKKWLEQHEKRIEIVTTKQFLFENKELECDFSFAFSSHSYDAGENPYNGAYQFKKHYYGRIGALDSEEETKCAIALDQAADVKFWIRNLPRKPHSYKLPLGGGSNFYPDFVVQLQNDKLLVVEYKGAHLVADSALKKTIGELMEKKSSGKFFFIMVTKDAGGQSIEQQVEEKIKRLGE